MKGQIVKIISNDYTIECDSIKYVCKSRGIFRHNKITPLVGDFVMFDKDKLLIEDILDRKNSIKRPPVSNIDQGFIVSSVKVPEFTPNLVDKLIVELELNNIEPIIIITKVDLIDDNKLKELTPIFDYYKSLGYKLFFNTELDKIKELFKDKVTVFTGQTGAGKSHLLNMLDTSLNLETGEVSESLGRGRHTTRVVSLYDLYGGKVLDTPGFSSLDLFEYTEEDIRSCFREFEMYPCKYKDCTHTKEGECVIKELVDKGDILSTRYNTYLKLIEDIKNNRRY